jgi:hypothetical protein
MRKILIPALAATVIAAVACGGDSATAPAPTIAGAYALKTVNSAPLPYLVLDDPNFGKIGIVADTYTLTDNGTYTGVTQVRTTLNGASSVDNLPSAGSYTKSGTSVTLTDSIDPTDKVSGTLNGSTLTISVEGFVLVYQRSGS